MSESGTHVVDSVKEWFKIDNELKVLQAEIKLRKERKKELTDALVNVLRDSDIDGWNTKEGKLEYVKTKIRLPSISSTLGLLLRSSLRTKSK